MLLPDKTLRGGGSPAGTRWRLNSTTGQILANGNNGLDVFGLSPIPEPTSLALLGIGAVALLRRR